MCFRIHFSTCSSPFLMHFCQKSIREPCVSVIKVLAGQVIYFYHSCYYAVIVSEMTYMDYIRVSEVQAIESLMVLDRAVTVGVTALSSRTLSHILWSSNLCVAWCCCVANGILPLFWPYTGNPGLQLCQCFNARARVNSQPWFQKIQEEDAFPLPEDGARCFVCRFLCLELLCWEA